MPAMSRRVAAVLTVSALLVLAACGGNNVSDFDDSLRDAPTPDAASATTPSDATAATPDAPPQDVPGVALDDLGLVMFLTELADDVGVDKVFETVAFALDRGYTPAQLAEGAAADQVLPDGTILDTEALHEPHALLDHNSVIQSLRRPPSEGIPVQQLADAVPPVHDDFNWRIDLEAGLADNVALAGALIALAEMGYSFDQVVEGLIFGELTVRFATSRQHYVKVDEAGRSTGMGVELKRFGCLALVGTEGDIIVPAASPAGGNAILERSGRCGDGARAGELFTAEQIAAQQRELNEGSPSTTANQASNTAGDDDPRPIDGMYRGSMTIGVPIPNYEITASAVEIAISDEAHVDLSADITLRYGARYQEDVVVCMVTTRFALVGTGTVGGNALEMTIEPDGYEILATDGAECGVVDPIWRTTVEEDIAAESDQEFGVMVGTIASGTIDASFAEGLFVVSATRD